MSVEKVRFKGGGGRGLIVVNENENNFLIKESVILHGDTLQPDHFTDLDGIFTKPIRYAGILKTPDTEITMCFYTGSDDDKGIKTDYYYCFSWISENRILNSYIPGSVRDLIWKEGKWK